MQELLPAELNVGRFDRTAGGGEPPGQLFQGIELMKDAFPQCLPVAVDKFPPFCERISFPELVERDGAGGRTEGADGEQGIDLRFASGAVEAGAGEAQVVFGQDVDMPAYDAPAEVDVRLCAQGEGYRLCGPWAESVTVEKEQLLGNQLSLECLPGEDTRCYTLRWNETKGDYYELQEWSDAQAGWETLAQVDREGELRYETGRLDSGSSHLYRVVARHRDAAEDTIQVGAEFFAAQPGEVSFRADFSPLYCSVWPVIDVGFYEVAGTMESVDTVPAGTCLCVLGEEDGFFYVRFGEDYGYVDCG